MPDFYCKDESGMSWMQTYSGIRFFPEDPRPHMICMDDIAHALSLSCRYNGQCRRFYSVAEHSVLVSTMVPPELALPALLHDAAEAYVGDIVRGVKHLVQGFAEIEDKILSVILLKYGCCPVLDPAIKQADEAVLYWEKQVLMPGHYNWGLREPLEKVNIECWNPEDAKRVFLGRFRELVREGFLEAA